MDQSKVNLERIRACDAGWDESKHPRADNGQFTSGGSGGGLRPMAAGSKAVNRAAEGKRLSHNAKVYIQTAHKAMESHNKKMAPEIESQQNKVQRAHSQLNNHYLNLSNRIRREYERAPEHERRNVSNKYGKLVDKVNEKYGGILHKEKEKLRDINEKERKYLAEKIAAQESRLVRARKYNSRTKKLQDLAKALHQKHPELARKAEAANEYRRDVKTAEHTTGPQTWLSDGERGNLLDGADKRTKQAKWEMDRYKNSKPKSAFERRLAEGKKRDFLKEAAEREGIFRSGPVEHDPHKWPFNHKG